MVIRPASGISGAMPAMEMPAISTRPRTICCAISCSLPTNRRSALIVPFEPVLMFVTVSSTKLIRGEPGWAADTIFQFCWATEGVWTNAARAVVASADANHLLSFMRCLFFRFEGMGPDTSVASDLISHPPRCNRGRVIVSGTALLDIPGNAKEILERLPTRRAARISGAPC